MIITMTDLKNIIPSKMYDIIERAGICTTREIITLSTWDIQKLTNMTEDDIHFLKTKVTTHVCPTITTAEKLEKERHIKTGCVNFDETLNGGFRIGTITEIYGESGAGKTQVALQIAAQCGKNGCVYICTEDTFPVKRFNQLTKSIQHTTNYDNQEQMFVEHLTESQNLLTCVRVRLPKLLEQNKVSTVIIDSIAAPFRVDVINYVQRAEELRELGIQLIKIAQKFSLAVICTNQVTSSFDELDNVLPSLGLAWSNMITYRLWIKKTITVVNKDKCNYYARELIIVFGPDLKNKICKFIIDADGIKSL